MDISLSQPYSFIQKGRRANQEDARFPDDDAPQGCRPVFVVCDGVGGQDKGEVASRIVSEAIGNYMTRVDLSHPFLKSDFVALLEYVCSSLRRSVTRETREMATTMTFVCFHSAGVFCAHIGDSRIYHIRPGVGVLYRSEDHSLVNALVHSGNITPEQAINHPQSNIITRSLSPEKPASATTLQIRDLEPGDYFFLCTDGVLHCLDDAALSRILSDDSSDYDKIREIAKTCRDSSDNNTAFLIRIADIVREKEDKLNGVTLDVDVDVASKTVPITDVRDIAEDVSASGKSRSGGLLDYLKKLF